MPKLRAALGRKGTPKTSDLIRACLEKQDAYTHRRHVRKRFARNLFTRTNFLDVWECDLFDLQAYTKYNSSLVGRNLARLGRSNTSVTAIFTAGREATNQIDEAAT